MSVLTDLISLMENHQHWRLKDMSGIINNDLGFNIVLYYTNDETLNIITSGYIRVQVENPEDFVEAALSRGAVEIQTNIYQK